MRSPSLVGRTLGGRYALRERLGEGGWGVVYAATQLDLGRPVALKVLHTNVALASDGLARFEREAKAAAALGHPNIAQVTDFQVNPGEPPFLVMELLTGHTLGAALAAAGRLPPARVAWIAHQILAALDVAHRAGIVHRDVKPDNVFLVSMPGVDDHVKLLDFGIAKLSSDTGGGPQLTTDGTMLGSPAYMAPEQVRGTGVDPRVDLYAVGATMYRALSGRLPFDAPNVHALLLAITEQRHVPLVQIDPSIDPALSAFVDRALHKDREGRFASAAAMRDALAPFVAQTRRSGAFAPPPSAYGPPPTPPYAVAAPAAPRSGSGAIVALLAVIAMLLLTLVGGGAAAFFLLRAHAPEPAAASPVATASAVASAPASTTTTSAPQASAAATSAPAAPGGGAVAPPRTKDAGAPAVVVVDAGGGNGGGGGGGRKQYGGGANVYCSGGSFNKYEIGPSREAIEKVMPAIKACYVATEYDPPDHQFNYYTLTVDPAGNVVNVAPVTEASSHPKLNPCLFAALRRVKLAAVPGGGTLQVGFTARTRDNP